MVPPITLVVVVGVGGIAVLLLLAHERPHLVELDLAGRRGKNPRARRERRGHVVRPSSPGGRRNRGGRRPGARSVGRRSPRRGVGARSGPSPRASGSGTAACPCARKSGTCRRYNRAAGCGPVGRRGGKRDSGSRSVRGRPSVEDARWAGASRDQVVVARCVRHYYAGPPPSVQ